MSSVALLDTALPPRGRCLRAAVHLPRPIRRSLHISRTSSKPDPPTKDVGKILKDIDSDKILKDVQDRWDKVEDKTSFAVYVGGGVLVLFVASSIISAFDKLPLLPKLFQLVGLVYTSWFVYRYLLFKSSRQELISDVEELKNKITGRE